jgi:hypothetical protein
MSSTPLLGLSLEVIPETRLGSLHCARNPSLSLNEIVEWRDGVSRVTERGPRIAEQVEDGSEQAVV